MASSPPAWPLLVSKLIDHAALIHGDREIVTKVGQASFHRSNWREVRARSKRLAHALQTLGAGRGDRIATLAWNGYRHVECLYGIAGMGGVAHTINPRLFVDQIVFIANHAQDRALLIDSSFLPLVEQVAPRLSTVEHFIIMCDREQMPASPLDLLCYEDLLAGSDPDFDWVELAESDPVGLCYTSGTTGDPKGVLYSNRTNVLHSLATAQPDVFDMSCRSRVLPVVPMFHANGWGVPYTAAAVGAKLVLNGPFFDAPSIHDLLLKEGVTLTLGVPTVWLALLQHLEQTGGAAGALERVMIGGSAAPRSMIEAFERRHGVTVVHAWGMTEMSPLGTVSIACSDDLGPEQLLELKCSQGRAPFGVELSIRDDHDHELRWDGRSQGDLLVRGAWTTTGYFRGEGANAFTDDGWFRTGDVAAIAPDGFMRITDRSKDVIKSGGEWISSIELENHAMGHPAVEEAAVIAVPHPKWDERPLLIVKLRPDVSLSRDEMLEYLGSRVARWWLPEEMIFVDDIPHTATGKIWKLKLREKFVTPALG